MGYEHVTAPRRRWRLSAGVGVALLTASFLALPGADPADAAPRASASPGRADERVATAARAAAASSAVPVAELRWSSTQPVGEGAEVVRVQQVRGGVPVYAGELATLLDASGAVLSVTGETTASRVMPRFVVPAAAARATALAIAGNRYPGDRAVLTAGGPSAYLYDPALVGAGHGRARSVWQVGVTGPPAHGVAVEVLVDAATGSTVAVHEVTKRLARSICDNQDDVASNIAAGSWCTQDDPDGYRLLTVDSSNPRALKAYDDLGRSAAFYADVLGVDLTRLVGLDTYRPFSQRRTPELTATVRYCEPREECPYRNAIWTDANPFFVPGPGRVYVGGQLFLGTGLEQAIDVTAHELTHGVTSAVNGLRYYGQSGAINESMSDVFGELAQLYDPVRRTFVPSRDPRWLVGEQLALPGLTGAVRSMSNPPTRSLSAGDPQPDRMTSALWESGWTDSGGVHTNSGVGNKTAYLIARGGELAGIPVRGIGERATARIYWRAQNMLTSGASYRSLATTLARSCASLYRTSSATCGSMRRATAATGIASSRLSLKASSTKVKAGHRVKVRAQLRGARGGELTLAPAERPRLVLVRRYLGTKKWVKVRSARTSGTGTVAWRVKVNRSAVYEVRYAGSLGRGLTSATKSRVVRAR